MKKSISNLISLLGLGVLAACGAGQSTGPRSMPMGIYEQSETQLDLAVSNKLLGAKPDLRQYTKVELLTEENTKTVMVYGVNFDFTSDDNTLARLLRDNLDMKKVVIHVDSLKVSHPLKLAGGVVEIIAGRLEFAGNGAIDVSGRDASEKGQDGGAAGVILLDVEQLMDVSLSPQKRFILNGGHGAGPMPGIVGQDGQSVTPLHDNVVYQEIQQQHCKTPAPTGTGGHFSSQFATAPQLKNSRAICHWTVQGRRGSRSCPSNGGDATAPGRAGLGGSRGQLISVQAKTTLLTAMIADRPGTKASDSPTYSGGQAGLPRLAVFETILNHANGSVEVQRSHCSETQPGQAKGPPQSLEGSVNSMPPSVAFSSSLKMLALQLAYASDLNAKGFLYEAQEEFLKVKKSSDKISETFKKDVYFADILKQQTLIQSGLNSLAIHKMPLKTTWRDYKNLTRSYLAIPNLDQSEMSEIMVVLLNAKEDETDDIPQHLQPFAASLNTFALEMDERLMNDETRSQEDFESMMVSQSQRRDFLLAQLMLHTDSQSIARMNSRERKVLVSTLRLYQKINDTQLVLWHQSFLDIVSAQLYAQNVLYREVLYSIGALSNEALNSNISLASDWLSNFDLKLLQVKQSLPASQEREEQVVSSLLAAPMEVEFQL